MSTLSRGDKGEIKVINVLEKINSFKFIINDFSYINEKTQNSHQIDHIFIHPHGIFVIETKNYFGEIVGNEGRDLWYKIVKGEKIVIANPIKQNKSHCFLIKKLLNDKYPVISVVVYAKNNAPYLDNENVINLSDLTLFIESYPYEKLISRKEMEEANDILVRANVPLSKEEHIQNVKAIKEMKEQFREDMRVAIETRMCPKCQTKLMVKGYSYSCPACGYKFKL